jgi:hypothetical protein
MILVFPELRRGGWVAPRSAAFRASLPAKASDGNTTCVAVSDCDRQDSGVPRQFHFGLVKAVRAGLAELGDPAKAPDMQRYMRSDMPFRGVQKPARTRLGARLFADYPLSDMDGWVATCSSCGAARSIRRSATSHWSWPGIASTPGGRSRACCRYTRS